MKNHFIIIILKITMETQKILTMKTTTRKAVVMFLKIVIKMKTITIMTTTIMTTTASALPETTAAQAALPRSAPAAQTTARARKRRRDQALSWKLTTTRVA